MITKKTTETVALLMGGIELEPDLCPYVKADLRNYFQLNINSLIHPQVRV